MANQMYWNEQIIYVQYQKLSKRLFYGEIQ